MIASAPDWQRPIWRVMHYGVAVALVPKGDFPIAPPLPGRGAITIVFDDEGGVGGSLGPSAYPRSLRRAIRRCHAAVMISCAPLPDAYEAAAVLAVMGQHVVLVETAELHEADWSRFLDRHAPRAARLSAIVGRVGAVQ